eukprot:TRINITY_DN7913_c0_g1_i1.p1 TRINITY_DN7913_c0_g1~~TRINITY_DN7913_c0_g1_i1.p1  ORF type:complete len:615 (-),score=180.63 TRINITY_DN7913_c0_g1_i1:21-1865(-)
MIDAELAQPARGCGDEDECIPEARLEFIGAVGLLTEVTVPFMLSKMLAHASNLSKVEHLCVRMVESGVLDAELNDPTHGLPLLAAAKLGASELCAVLVQRGVPVNPLGAHDETALHGAVQCSQPRAVQQLLELGADPTIACTKDLPGMAPLHEAAILGCPDILQELLEHPAVHAQTLAYWHRTPLQLLCIAAGARGGVWVECAELLLEAKADMDAQDVDGCTALGHAVKSNSAELVQLLLQYGADLRLRDVHNETAGSVCLQPAREHLLAAVVDYAPEKSKGPVAWLLRDHAPYGHRVHGLGGSFHDESLAIWASKSALFLHSMCYWGTEQSVELITGLLEYSPEGLNVSNHRGQTPLQVALAVHNEAAIRALIKGGAEATEQLVSAALEQQLPGVRVLFALGLGDFLASTREIVLPEPPSSTMADALAWCSSTGLKYVDMCFPPSLSSLAQCKLHSQHRDVEWVRLSELGLSSMEWGATLQCGALGDPFFLSAMPVCSAGMIETHPESAACGVYTVNLQWQGQEHSVVVDDFIPVLDGKSALCESADHSAGAQLYIKACAKLAGSFEALSMCRRADHFDQTVFELTQTEFCLLYTSDAADEEDSVDLGGRRNI